MYARLKTMMRIMMMTMMIMMIALPLEIVQVSITPRDDSVRCTVRRLVAYAGW